MFGLGELFSNICSRRRAAKKIPEIVKNMFGESFRLYNGFTHFHMQTRCNKKQMYLNTTQTYFEGPRSHKVWFRDPGSEDRNYMLFNCVHVQGNVQISNCCLLRNYMHYSMGERQETCSNTVEGTGKP